MSEIKLPITLTTAAVDLAKEAAEVIVEAQSYKITTSEQFANSMELLKKIKSVSNKLEAERTAQKAPILAAGRDVDSLYKAETDKLLKAEKVLKDAGIAFQWEEQRKAAELQAKLRAEAEEKARKEQEKLLAQAAKAAEQGKTEKADMLLDKAENVQAFVPVIQAVETKVAGVSTRKVWKYRIVDVNKLPREYMVPNDAMLSAFAKSTQGNIPVAGVEFYSEAVLAVSSR